MFNPAEDEEEDFQPEIDEFGKPVMGKDGKPLKKRTPDEIQFEKEKAENLASANKLQGRRENLSPYIEKFKSNLIAVFHNDPQPADLYTALELLYDWTLAKLEAAMNKTYEEASQWMRVANDLIEIDEYALMESFEDLITPSSHSATRDAVEQQYSNLIRSANGNFGKEAVIFTEIAFALVSIIEDQISANPDDAEDYIEIKETLDRKYGPMYKGMQNQLADLSSKDRRYGRVTQR